MKINGQEIPQRSEISEVDCKMEPRLFRAAVNAWLTRRGLSTAETFIGVRGREQAKKRQKKRLK